MSRDFDLVVVGGGPGGYTAAIRAAQLGFNTALVEKQHLGGVCLNWGCIPTKALLRGAELLHHIREAGRFGISTGEVSVDIEKLVGHSRKTAQQLSGGIAYLMKKNNITVIDGTARVTGKCELDVDGEKIVANHIVLATGARAKSLPFVPKSERVWGASEAMTPKAIPAHIVIVGAGAIGVEFASLYRDLGSEVTLIEAVERIVPAEDEEVSAYVEKQFQGRGIRVLTRASIASVEDTGSKIVTRVTDRDGQAHELHSDCLVQAVGITGNIENIGLEALGVETDRGFIKTNSRCQTNVVGLYAIGDVAGPPWLAHKASHEALACIEQIAGIEHHGQPAIPGCTYSRPQIASIGLSERAAREKVGEVRVGRFNMRASGKAIAIGEPEGFVKTVFDERTGELLGAHMVGPEVTEQIQGFAVAIGLEATEAELLDTVFPHPTLSEAMHESILDSLGRAINQ